jgi:tRNA-Thr(GGU) m(6)t(6)A37 methyltransferase TsaA
MENIIYQPIGFIRSPFKEIQGTPIQPAAAKGIKGTVELFSEYLPGLKDLEEFSHLILIYHLHLSIGFSLEVVPFLDKVKRGVFATRAPKRPNSIGISVVKLIQIKENYIDIENIDVVDKTPLLDIKPYIPPFEITEEVKLGWLKNVLNNVNDSKADDRFK